MPADDDGDIPYLLFDRYLRKIKYFKFHADRVPLSQNRGKCASYPEVDGAREQAENRRGFGAKQTAVCEVYPAFVTWMTKKPSKLIYSRMETQTASSPRHEMEMHVRLGAMKDGTIRGIDLYTLSNTGAYGEHGPTTVGLSGHKSIPLYGSVEAFRFISDVVYTNIMSAGAYRGYGATQGLFAIESAVNELADQIQMDRFEIRLKNMVKEGDLMPAYYNQVNTSCALDRCVKKVREMIGWEDKYPVRDMGNGKVRSVGMGMAMQGSAITAMDVGSAVSKSTTKGSIHCRSERQIWEPAVTRFWRRLRRKCWNAQSTRSRCWARTRIHPRMTQVLMHRVRLI